MKDARLPRLQFAGWGCVLTQPAGLRARRPVKQAREAAFTLVELLVVMAILAVLIGVIGACLTGAIRVWDAVRTNGEAEAQIGIALRIVERDLANMTPFCDVGMRGNPDEVTFAGLRRGKTGAAERLQLERADGSAAPYELTVVRYRFDKSRGTLERSRWRVPPTGGADGDPPTPPDVLLSQIRSLAFEYEAVGDDGVRRLRPDWNSRTNYPVALRMDMRTRSERGTRRTVQLFRIPVRAQPPVPAQ